MNEIGRPPDIHLPAQFRVSVADGRENRGQVEYCVLTGNGCRYVLWLSEVAEQDLYIPAFVFPSEFLSARISDVENGYRMPAMEALIHDNHSDAAEPAGNQDIQ
jgi:hypothetical protein